MSEAVEAVRWLVATGEMTRLVREEIAPVVAQAMVENGGALEHEAALQVQVRSLIEEQEKSRQGWQSMVDQARQNNEVLQAQVKALAEERDEVRRLQRSRMSRAISIWQAFFAKPDTIPDLGELLDWMVERYNVLACKYHAEADRAEQAEQQRDAFAAAVERLLGTASG